MRVSTPGMNRVSQASPATDAEPTHVAFRLVPEDPGVVDENPEDVRKAVRSGCGGVRLSDVEIDIDIDAGEGVTVDAVNSTEYAPSRVLHVVWAKSETDYRAIPRPRDEPRLTWARGVLIDQGEDEDDLP